MATARRVAAETRDIDNPVYHPADVGARRCHPAMSGDLEPLPARLAGRAGRGPGGAGGRAAGPVRAELPVIGRAGEREQVLVSAWLTGLRSARTRRACAGDVAGLGR